MSRKQSPVSARRNDARKSFGPAVESTAPHTRGPCPEGSHRERRHGPVSGEIQAQSEALACLISNETGKPIAAARLEVERAVFTFEIASEEAKRIEGDILPLDLAPNSAGRMGIIRRFPIGPLAAITPFNFPLNLVAHKVTPAIAAGNTVVLKPSSSAPLTALALARIIESSALPAGAFNVVPCLGDEADQLVANEQIRLVSFTGSPDIGWKLKQKAGVVFTVLLAFGCGSVLTRNAQRRDAALARLGGDTP